MTKRSWEDRLSIVRYSNKFGCQKTADHYGISLYSVKEVRRWVRKRIKKHRNTVTPEYLEKVRAKAQRFAIKKQRPEDADDFGQYLCIETWRRGRVPKVEWAWPDFNRSYKQSRADFKNGIIQIVDFEKIPEPIQDARQDDFSFDITGLKSMDRAIILLYSQWRMTLKEIGYLFGVTEPAICIRVEKIRLELIKKGGIENE